MKVRIISGVYGRRDEEGRVSPVRAGELAEVKEEEARRLVSLGVAELTAAASEPIPASGSSGRGSASGSSGQGSASPGDAVPDPEDEDGADGDPDDGESFGGEDGEGPVPDEEEAEEEELDWGRLTGMKVDALKAFAAGRGIDLTGARFKKEILERIAEFETKPNPVMSEPEVL